MTTHEKKSDPANPSKEILDDAVRRILSVVKPRRIILFGSAARGNMGPHSDLDFLVVMPDGTHRRNTSVEIFKALRGIDLPKDVIVVTEQDVAQFGSNHSLIIMPAFRDGKNLCVSIEGKDGK